MFVAGLTAIVVLEVIAIEAIFLGILEIVTAIHARKEFEGTGWMVFAGARTVLFGLLLLTAPLAFGQLIVRILGAYAVIYGVSSTVLAFRLRKLGKTASYAARAAVRRCVCFASALPRQG